MANTKEQEIWKTYPEIPFIQASNLGRIRTIDRVVTYKNGAKHFYKGCILKQRPNKKGYMYVHVSANGKSIYLSVHRIVATCFIPNPNGYPEVNHIDCDRTNNRWDNLEWCSHEYNIEYREKYGKALSHPVFAVNLENGKVLRFESQSKAVHQLNILVGNINDVLKGRLNTAGGYWFTEDESEITEEKIREIKAIMKLCQVIAVNSETSEVFWFESRQEAERQLGVDHSSISKVVRGKQHKACGWWFTNADENAVEKTREKFGDKVAKKVEELISEHCN